MIERIEQLAAHARRLVQTRGCAKIDDIIHQFRLIAGASASRRFGEAVARSAGRFEWLDQETRWFWYVPERTFRANPLVNHIRRELGAVSRIELSQLRLEVRPYFETDMSCPPVHVLAAICRRLLFARLEGEVVIGEPNLLARDAVLDQTEATMVRILGVHGSMRGWLSDGRVFVAWRLDKSTLEGGVLRIHEPMSSFIEGDYELTTTRNQKLGSIQIRQRACWDVRPLLRWSSAGVGDTLVLIFDPREQIAEGFVGDDLFAAQVLSPEVDLHLLIRDVGHDLDRGAENHSAELATSATSAVGERALAAG
jgi:hypothetical protein